MAEVSTWYLNEVKVQRRKTRDERNANKKALPEQSFIENSMDFATIPSQGFHPLCSEQKKDCSLSELL
jgi:hypothetical protein